VRDHDELTLNRRPVMILSRESTGQARGGCTAFGQLVSGQQHQKLGNDQAMTREMCVTEYYLLNLQYRWGTEGVFY
jgi:hypothetical protein